MAQLVINMFFEDKIKPEINYQIARAMVAEMNAVMGNKQNLLQVVNSKTPLEVIAMSPSTLLKVIAPCKSLDEFHTNRLAAFSDECYEKLIDKTQDVMGAGRNRMGNPKGHKMKDIRVNVVGKHRKRVKKIVYDTANFGSIRERKIHADLMFEILNGR